MNVTEVADIFRWMGSPRLHPLSRISKLGCILSRGIPCWQISRLPQNGAEEAAAVSSMGAAILWGGGGAAAAARGVCNGWIEWPPLGNPRRGQLRKGLCASAAFRESAQPQPRSSAAHISTTPKRTGGGRDGWPGLPPTSPPPCRRPLPSFSTPPAGSPPFTGFWDTHWPLGVRNFLATALFQPHLRDKLYLGNKSVS